MVSENYVVEEGLAFSKLFKFKSVRRLFKTWRDEAGREQVVRTERRKGTKDGILGSGGWFDLGKEDITIW